MLKKWWVVRHLRESIPLHHLFCPTVRSMTKKVNVFLSTQLRVSLGRTTSKMFCPPAISRDQAWHLPQACAQAACCCGAHRRAKQGSASMRMAQGLLLQVCTMARCCCLALAQSHSQSSMISLCLLVGMGVISCLLSTAQGAPECCCVWLASNIHLSIPLYLTRSAAGHVAMCSILHRH